MVCGIFLLQLGYLGDNLHEGDVILSNHPSAGGSHLPDLTVITPVGPLGGWGGGREGWWEEWRVVKGKVMEGRERGWCEEGRGG